jgi:hypothetical protein
MLVLRLQNCRLSKMVGVLNEDVVYFDRRSDFKGIKIPANKQILDKKHEIILIIMITNNNYARTSSVNLSNCGNQFKLKFQVQ